MKTMIQAALAALALGPAHAREFLKDAVPWVTYGYKGAVFGGTAAGMTYNPVGFAVAEVKLDFPAIALARAAAGQVALAATDILEVVGVKAGTWVPMVAAQVVTAEGEAATIGVGDGTTPSGFISAGDANALGWLHSLVTTTYSLATAGGKLYTADDTIDVLLNTAAFNVAVIHLFVPMVDLRRSR